MVIDHLGFGVADYERSKAFYLAVLAPLGIGIAMEIPEHQACGFGRDGKPEFWIAADHKAASNIHVAFTAQSRELVDAFYKASLGAGAKDNGAPGLRPHYHPNYYGAFVIDPDGNNIEAVCHKPVG
jgi:catechol 2,3-dioxygenase-like lactoylglutathione lyase family enzyme